MPTAAYRRACVVAGCRQAVTFRGRCAEHARETNAFEIDAAKGPYPLGMPPAKFLREYWQKKPLLIRNAFPGFVSHLKCASSSIVRKSLIFLILAPQSSNRTNTS